MNLGLKDTYRKGTRPGEWPRPLTDAEQAAILQAAAEAGRDAHITVAAMLYVGARPLDVVNMAVYAALGDAIKLGNGFLAVPWDFKRIVVDELHGQDITYGERVTGNTEKEAAAAAVAAFDAAGLDTAGAWLRLRRTAAILHHMNRWTKDSYIEDCFTETARMPGALKDVYYNPDMEQSYNRGGITEDGAFIVPDILSNEE